MGSLRTKLDHLERLTGAGDCLLCRDDGRPPKVSVCWEEGVPPDSGLDTCPACGRQLVTVVTWGADDESPTAA